MDDILLEKLSSTLESITKSENIKKIYVSSDETYISTKKIKEYLSSNYEVIEVQKWQKYENPSIYVSYIAKYGTPIAFANSYYPQYAVVKSSDKWEIFTLQWDKYIKSSSHLL